MNKDIKAFRTQTKILNENYDPKWQIMKLIDAEVEICAMECRGISTMFAVGTNDYPNDYGGSRCYESHCNCLCETAANADGTCNQATHNGYKLYTYQKGKEGYFRQ